jgi:transaldolase/glucose-6-phosphate isomerase
VDLSLPAEMEASVERLLSRWREEGFAERLWRRDPTLWAQERELPAELADRLGWLDLPERALEQAAELATFAQEARAEGVERVVLMGMGGSSLAPEVFQAVLGGGPGYPRLVLLDSTHPGAVTAVREEIDPARTIFVVASKSGTTAETMSLFHYLWRETAAVVDGPTETGSRFVAITDPG